MSIQVGDAFPSVDLRRLGDEGMETINTAEALKGKRIVLFAVPGAFTPACSQKHLPGYVQNAASIKAKGVDAIICTAVNDPFVMKNWSDSVGAVGKIDIWPDGNGELRDALGLMFDASANGLGKRFKRFSMLIENGIVKSLEVEDVASDVSVSGADVCLMNLAA